MNTRRVAFWLRDRIFPLAEPLTNGELACVSEREAQQMREWRRRSTALPMDTALLGGHLDSCRSALESEDRRRTSVEARLTTIVGLLSVAVSIVVGALVAGAGGDVPWSIIWLMWYLVLQLTAAVLAGIRGLERRSYLAFPIVDLLPATEVETRRLRLQIEGYGAVLAQHQAENNKKVTQMAVAHTAVKNFIVALLVLASVAAALTSFGLSPDVVVDIEHAGQTTVDLGTSEADESNTRE